MADVPTVIPFVRYEDAPKAIEWLKQAFGFEEQIVYPGENGTILHAELGFGNGVIMIGSASNEASRRMSMTTARQAGGSTIGVYAHVDDVDGHFERAKAAGAEVINPPADQEYGAREYAVKDLEGNVWSFGNYVAEAYRS